MAKYKESTVTGETWHRAYQILCNNKHNEVPNIWFFEEEVIKVGDKIIANQTGRVGEQITVENMNTTFNLKNPDTDEYIKGATATYQDLFVLLYSLYHHLADERDLEVARGPNPYSTWILDKKTNTWVSPVPKPYPSWIITPSGKYIAPTTHAYPSWTWDENIVDWVPPVPVPDTEHEYDWDEETLSWKLTP